MADKYDYAGVSVPGRPDHRTDWLTQTLAGIVANVPKGADDSST